MRSLADVFPVAGGVRSAASAILVESTRSSRISCIAKSAAETLQERQSGQGLRVLSEQRHPRVTGRYRHDGIR